MPLTERQAPHTIVHVLGTAQVRGTAQARIVAALARSLDPGRFRLCAWFLDEPGPLAGTLAVAGVPSRTVAFRGRTDLPGALRVAHALRADAPALVHLHVGGRSLLWLLRTLSPARRVIHLHTDRTEEGSPTPLASLTRGVDAVVATSMFVANATARRATVVYPGVDVPEAVTLPPPGPPKIGAVGRLERVKGLSVLIKAAALLRDGHPNIRIELAGSGPCEPELRSLAAQVGISDSLTFLGWREDLDAVHRGCHVFAQPSLHEGFGLAALEAMAAGRPVVASATGGLPELVEDDHTGFLVPVGDVGALANQLGKLLADEGLRLRFGEAARRRVREHFSTAEMATKIARVYDSLLGR